MTDKETHLRGIAIDLASLLPVDHHDAAAVIHHVKELLAWRSGSAPTRPKLTLVPFQGETHELPQV